MITLSKEYPEMKGRVYVVSRAIKFENLRNCAIFSTREGAEKYVYTRTDNDRRLGIVHTYSIVTWLVQP